MNQERIEKLEEFKRKTKKEGAAYKGSLDRKSINQNGKINVNGKNNRIYYSRRHDNRHLNGPYMVDCPNCSRRVSRKAVSCPGCSHPVSLHFKKMALQKTVKLLSVTLAALIVGMFLAGQPTLSPFFSIPALLNITTLTAAIHKLKKIPSYV